MLQHKEVRATISDLAESFLKSGLGEDSQHWSALKGVLDRVHEVSGIVLYMDDKLSWDFKTVEVCEDSHNVCHRLRDRGYPSVIFKSVYHRIGFTKEMYEKLYSIPKSLDGLDRLAVLAREYAENLSRTSADRKIIFYCGPVNATGGFMDLEMNLEHLFRAIMKGASRYEPVFDQTVFESHLVEITKQVKENPAINQSIVLDRFYKPLYKNWLVKEMRFLFNWQTSGGATWEMNLSKEKNIPSVVLPEEYVDLSFARKNAPQN